MNELAELKKKENIARNWLDRFYVETALIELGLGKPERLAEVERQTKEVIAMIDDTELQKIASSRYLDFLQWEDIADLVYISRATVYRHNTKILLKVFNIIRKEGLII